MAVGFDAGFRVCCMFYRHIPASRDIEADIPLPRRGNEYLRKKEEA